MKEKTVVVFFCDFFTRLLVPAVLPFLSLIFVDAPSDINILSIEFEWMSWILTGTTWWRQRIREQRSRRWGSSHSRPRRSLRHRKASPTKHQSITFSRRSACGDQWQQLQQQQQLQQEVSMWRSVGCWPVSECTQCGLCLQRSAAPWGRPCPLDPCRLLPEQKHLRLWGLLSSTPLALHSQALKKKMGEWKVWTCTRERRASVEPALAVHNNGGRPSL